jgi:hypothetical protein
MSDDEGFSDIREEEVNSSQIQLDICESYIETS